MSVVEVKFTSDTSEFHKHSWDRVESNLIFNSSSPIFLHILKHNVEMQDQCRMGMPETDQRVACSIRATIGTMTRI